MSIKDSSIHTKRYKKILSAVHMVYRLVNSTYNTQELCLRLTRLLCQFINADSATVYLLDPHKQKVILRASFDNKINILHVKQKDLLQNISDKEKKVIQGYSVLEKHLLGLPLVADENIGAIILKRKSGAPAFENFDKDMLGAVTEQSVTAVKNLQLHEEQQRVILGSIEFIGKLLEQHGNILAKKHTPIYFNIVKVLAEKMNLSHEGIKNLYYASILRDAGAIDVPFEILSKSSRLTAEEFKVIRQQPKKSAELIRPVVFLKPVLPIILYHHEHYDGSGYPSGLKKEQIPLGARIMAVADAFDAMTNERPYKKLLNFDEAINELKNHSGTQFDPKIVKAFIELAKQKKFRNYLRLTRKR